MRGWIYDRAITRMTRAYYAAVLDRLPDGSRLLDIGIGTAGALLANAGLVRARDIRVMGVDIDKDYIARAERRINAKNLEKYISVRLVSIYDFHESGFDAAYFSSSFMLMPDPIACLEHVLGLLKANGIVYFTQTFEGEPNPLMEKAKPLIKNISTIDFGRVTYEEPFFETVKKAGLEVLEHIALSRGKARNARLVIGRAAR